MAILRATDDAGVFEVEGIGTKIRLLEWRAGGYYDTVELASGAQTSGNQAQLFQNLSQKSRQHTNLDNNAGRLPALNELICNRVGAHVHQAWGNTVVTDDDILKVAHACYMRISVNQTRIIFDAPLYTAQSGYGVTGSTTRTATGVVTIGVASQAAAPQLLVAQPIGPQDSIGTDSYIQTPGLAWLTTTTMASLTSASLVTVFLDGLIKKPANA